MSGADRRVLFVTGECLLAFRGTRNTLLDTERFPADATGLEAFARYLAVEPDLPNVMLLDLIEEEFRLERLPHAPIERRRIALRVASRLFHRAPFQHWERIGRERKGRRDDEVLFSAVTNAEAIRPWLEALHAAKAPLVAVSSLPYLTERLLRSLQIEGRHLVLVSESEHGGLRQTYLRDGRLLFSRLSPRRPAGADHATFVRDEIGKTSAYLHHLRLLAAEAVGTVHVLSDTRQHSGLTDRPGANGIDPVPLRISDAAARLQMNEGGETPFVDRLLAQAAMRGMAPNIYASARDRRYAHHATAGRALRWATGAVLAVGIAGTAQALLDVSFARAAARQAETEIKTLPQAQDAIAADPPGRMRAAVESVESLQALPMSPGRLLAHVGRVLVHFPEFRVDRLRWRGGGHDAVGEIAAAEDAGPPDGETQLTGIRHAVAIEGEISPFDGDFRQVLTRLDRLLGELEATVPGLVVARATRRPLELDSTLAVTGDSARGAAKAPFAIVVVARVDG